MKNAFVETANMKRFLGGLTGLERRGAQEACLLVVDGLPGLGKTTAIRRWATQTNAIFVRAKKEWTPGWFVNDLLAELRIAPAHSYQKRFAQALEAMLQRQTQLMLQKKTFAVVIDEADHISRKAEIMESIRDFSDMGDIVFVLVGMGRIRDNLTRFPQIASRIAQYVKFEKASRDDVKAFFATRSEVPVADDVVEFVTRIFERDSAVLKAKYIAWFEQESGRTVYPMQVEMLLIEALAYAMSLLGEEAQIAHEQAFVAFGVGDNLDRLGPNRSTQRLEAAPAVTRLRFSVNAPAQWNIVIDAGSEVSAGVGAAFATDGVAIIPAGALTAEVGATATVAGVAGNGFLPGQISNMAVTIDGVSCANVTTSEGGALVEADPAYQLRLANAFDRVSSGGGYGWYRETAMGVSSAIVDVGVVRPAPCYIEIYPLTVSGAAGPDLRAQVLAAFQTERALENRFGDEVSVLAASGQHRSPTLTLRAVNPSATLEEDATKIAMAMLVGFDFSAERAELQALAKSIWGALAVDGWGQRLAAIVAPSEVTTAVKRLSGVVDADLSGLLFGKLGEDQYLVIDSLTVNVEVIG